MRPKKLYNGFTLIELLIVISVLALLLAILAPVLRQARNAAKTIYCSSIQRNLFTAHYSYFSEYSLVMPISIQNPTVVVQPWHTYDDFRIRLGLSKLSIKYKTKYNQLQEYKPSYPKNFICPSAAYALSNEEKGLYPLERTFGLNAHIHSTIDGTNVKNNLLTPERIILVDSLHWWFNYWGCDKYQIYGENWVGPETYGMVAYRHLGKTNVSYWDGHCERLNPNELKNHLLYWMRGYTIP